MLVFQLSTAFLSSTDIGILTDRARLRARYEKARTDHANVTELTPSLALDTFKSYVRDSATNDDANKRIPSQNRRFQSALGGDDTHNLLTRLGFRLQGPTANQTSAQWFLPKPIDVDRGTDQPLQSMLEDVKDELNVLIEHHKSLETNSTVRGPPISTFARDAERLMGSPDSNSLVRSASFYRTLGALPEFSDASVSFCYEQQAATDPSNTPTYLECLKEIASERGSEMLQTQVVTLESQGHLTQSSINEAYGYFNINPSHAMRLNDNHILDIFRARVPDVGYDELPRMKLALRTLGEARQSQMLIHAATDAMETYEQALAFFDIDATQSDDFIPSLVTVKTEEDPTNRDIAKKAVQLIADHRDSAALRYYLEHGDLPSGELSIQEAYNLLNISYPDAASDQLVIDAYTSAFSVSPTRQEELLRAFDTIATHRDSPVLLWESQQIKQNTGHPPTAMDEPRGLRNIGNTCYLNSLLQYFFSIKSVREVVEKIEENKEKPLVGTGSTKTVGSESVSDMQIDRALQFIHELGKLFDNLIAARSTFIQPEENLARLTLHVVVGPQDEQVPRRRSTLVGRRPTLTSPKIASTTKPVPEVDSFPDHDSAIDMKMSPDRTSPLDSDLSGTSTLRNESDAKMETVPELNDISQPMNERDPNFDDSQKDSNAPVKPSRDAIQDTSQDVMEIEHTAALATDPETHPQPPVVPPRPQEPQRPVYEEWAQQHDVEEVIQNVLYQLRWAMRPEGREASGEQIDAISRLFFGKEEYVTSAETQSAKTQSFCCQVVYLREAMNTIYDALDSAFDRMQIDGASETQFTYKTIVDPPPVFQIYVNRVNYSLERGTYKVMSQLNLDHEIYLDRYMTDDDMLAKRKQSWMLKERCASLNARREALTTTETDLDIPATLLGMRDYLSQIANEDLGEDTNIADEATLAALETMAHETRQEIKELESEIRNAENQLAETFDRTGQLKYRLHCAFVHRGEASHGHWFIYIHDPKDNVWRVYNDEEVSVVTNTAEVYAPDSIRHGTAAFVTYVRADREREIVDTVCRNTASEAPRPPPKEYTPPFPGLCRGSRRQPVLDLREQFKRDKAATMHQCRETPSCLASPVHSLLRAINVPDLGDDDRNENCLMTPDDDQVRRAPTPEASPSKRRRLRISVKRLSHSTSSRDGSDEVEEELKGEPDES
ncbi:MAG: ubiquitin-specific protease ubp2 [Chrysothrix sp. TS-e1954]|nr:MAG: ubiquitin-specific protease ubp2 [Chrysothrix sp. TS-e1954]